MHAIGRSLAVALIAGAAAILLSGCFVIPLVDGRSPFDDPSNASRDEIDDALPLVQTALDESGNPDPAWRAVARMGAGNCEGACDLHVEVAIEPVDTAALAPIERPDLVDNGFTIYAAPEQALRAAIVAAVPVAEAQKVDVSFVPGLGETADAADAVADLSGAAESLFGAGGGGDGYEVSVGEYLDGSVTAFTRTHTDVLASMGLD